MSRRANRGRVGRPVTASLRHDRDLTVGSVFPTRVALARGRCSVGVVACLLALFAVLFSIVRRGASRELDLRATVALQRRQQPWFRRLMETVSWPGFPPQSRLIPPLLALLWLLLGYPLEAVFQFAGWGTGLISFLVKRTMRRPRPTPYLVQVEAANIGGSSFPSGHVINYIGIYGTLAYLTAAVVRPAWVRKPVLAICGTLIALVGPSRIYLGHHWLTDVTASFLLGTSYVLGLTALYRRVKVRSLVRERVRPNPDAPTA